MAGMVECCQVRGRWLACRWIACSLVGEEMGKGLLGSVCGDAWVGGGVHSNKGRRDGFY